MVFVWVRHVDGSTLVSPQVEVDLVNAGVLCLLCIGIGIGQEGQEKNSFLYHANNPFLNSGFWSQNVIATARAAQWWALSP